MTTLVRTLPQEGQFICGAPGSGRRRSSGSGGHHQLKLEGIAGSGVSSPDLIQPTISATGGPVEAVFHWGRHCEVLVAVVPYVGH